MRRSTTLACPPIYAGIDFHKNFSVVSLGDEKGALLSTEKLANDEAGVRKFFRQYPGLKASIESCRGYEWLVELLTELGVEVHLVNAHEVKLIAQSRCKSDRVDSRILMELLAIGYLPECYQPTAEERKLREYLRWRCHLVRNATRIKVRIHSLIDKENLGVYAAQLFTARGRRYLADLELKGPGRQELLEKHLRFLDQVEEMIHEEDAWVRKAAKSTPQAQLLMTIPGIAEFSALVILAELGEIKRFGRADQVCNFAGLVPSVHSSADKRFTGRLTKQGSSLLRWVLIQDAWVAIRVSLPLRQHFTNVSRRCGRHAAVVSVARKLIKIAYRVLRDEKPFDSKLVGAQSA